MGSQEPVPMPSDDAQLMERMRDDPTGESLRTLYRTYAGELLGFALNALSDRETAEEIVQETFTRAWRHADRYDPARASARPTLARNPVEGDPLEDMAGGPSIEQAMLGWQVAAALAKLTPEHRQVIRLAHVRGMSVREIAEVCDLPEGTVKSRTWYALRSLRLVLEEMGVTP
jgi:RNA polymerase sigma-70 factor (ECF subfamily)